MYPPKPFATKVVMTVVSTMLTLASVLGNGFVLAVLARFKELRTVPNILTANLASVDLLNAAINMPIYVFFSVLEADWFRGKSLAILSIILHRIFICLNLVSRLLMMANMYLAIAFDLKYLLWKTNKKALTAVVLLWLASNAVVLLLCLPLNDIDLGDAHVIEYREEMYKQAKAFSGVIFGLFIAVGAVLGIMTCRSILLKKRQRAQLNLPPLVAQARLSSDIKASCTIAISVSAFFVCYIPSIVYATFFFGTKDNTDSWFAFFAWCSLFISNVTNPVLYFLRTGRFRSSLRQFFNDPFGNSGFKGEALGGKHSKRRNHADLLELKFDEPTESSQEVDMFEPTGTYGGVQRGEEERDRMGMPSTEGQLSHRDPRSSQKKTRYTGDKGKGDNDRGMTIQVEVRFNKNVNDAKETKEGKSSEKKNRKTSRNSAKVDPEENSDLQEIPDVATEKREPHGLEGRSNGQPQEDSVDIRMRGKRENVFSGPFR